MVVRKKARLEYPVFKKFAYAICLLLIRTLYRIRLEGPYKDITGPAILIANHRHALDPVAIHTAIRPWIYWVAKKELFTDSLGGQMVRRLGCIPVDREHVDLIAARGIFGRLRQGDIVGIFPQGTRVADESVNDVAPHTGAVHFAIKTGVPIIPVGIKQDFRLFREVRVVFGQQYRLDQNPRQHYTQEELDRIAHQMMQSVFDLIGMPYTGGGTRKKKTI